MPDGSRRPRRGILGLLGFLSLSSPSTFRRVADGRCPRVPDGQEGSGGARPRVRRHIQWFPGGPQAHGSNRSQATGRGPHPRSVASVTRAKRRAARADPFGGPFLLTSRGKRLTKENVHMLFKQKRYSQSIRPFTAKDLVESRTLAEICAKMDIIFGDETTNNAIDNGNRPTRRYVLANRYRADLDYAVRVRDVAETEKILKIIFKALRSEGPVFNPSQSSAHPPLIQKELFPRLTNKVFSSPGNLTHAQQLELISSDSRFVGGYNG